jgi:fructose-1-phosphate kinase PfkB-like protein
VLFRSERIGADTSGMVITAERPTNTYTKPMRRQPDGSWQEINRLDMRSFAPLPASLEKKLIGNLAKAVSETMGVAVVDQYAERNFAAVTDGVREALSRLARENPDTFFYGDSRRFVAEFRDIITKCNEIELLNAMEPGANADDRDAIVRNGRMLREKGGNAAVVTLGAQGACVFEAGGETWLPAFRVEGPLDIVGAGDATSAGTLLGLTLGLPLPTAALLGSCVSSITIQQMGVTGTATVSQVAERLQTLL